MPDLDLTEFRLEEPVKLVVAASTKLKCDARTRCKTLIIYHQFKRCIGETHFDPHLLAAACMSLSVKANGEDIELDAILMTFFCMLDKERSTLSEEFKNVKESLIMMECIILRMIDFDLNHRLAHEFLLYFLLDGKEELTCVNMWHVVSEISMKIISDFYLVKKCLNYKAEEIASVAIQVALYQAGIDINTSSYMRIWIERMKEVTRKLDLFEDIFRICEVSAAAEDEE